MNFKSVQSPQRKLEVDFASSIRTCSKADSKIFAYYSAASDVEFDEHISNCGSRAIINLATNKGEDKDNIKDYIERIEPYFFFYALAVVLLIVWIFYCSCCCCPCCPACCCVQKYEDYYVRNMAFTIAVIGFILIIGGCFAGFFFKTFLMEDINGVICSFERLYFDIMEGQINLGLPKWPGLNNMSYKLDTLYNVLQTISSTTKNYGPDMNDWQNNENSQLVYKNYETAIRDLLSIKGKYHYHYLIAPLYI